MRIAILSGGTGWHVQDLLRAAGELGHTSAAVDFRALFATHTGSDPLADFDAIIVRTMPAGSLEQIVFRMDVLQQAVSRGQVVLNAPKAVETCVDKFLTDHRLRAAGLPVPVSVVCQRWQDAMPAFESLGRDVVVKPLFGSEGRGMVRVTDRELAWRTFHAIEQTGGVIYLQQFIRHPGWDVRAFVLNGKILGAMRRTAKADWRTNVAQGGTAEACELTTEQTALAIAATEAVGAGVAGVDLLCDDRGEWYVIEVNAVPGWRALSEACGVDVAAELVGWVQRA
ncbi:MAG: RimK family alpha-L-glutamate ligase [Fimbriiglobus sp.]|nr:RimK family alpha-L-glutamate ligase [Fimbriiglobus sp.]